MRHGLADLAPLPLSGLMRPVAVDYDPVDRMVYWTDLLTQPSATISRAHLDGSNQMTVVDGLRVPDGLALDIESRMVYWTDGVLEHIGRAPTDGTGNKEIIVTDVDTPRAIFMDHAHGHIYWTDVGLTAQIARADLNGGSKVVLIEDGLQWPNGIAVDSTAGYIYWCDARLDIIGRSDLGGNNRIVLANLTRLGLPFHPFDIALYNDNLYWTDWVYSIVLRVHVNGKGEQPFGGGGLMKSGGIHIQEEPSFCDSFPCANGATCNDEVNGFSCECPDGFQGNICSVAPGFCDSSPCASEATCIDEVNGFSCECPDGFQGITCSIDLNECDSSPCANGAACIDEANGFSCECSDGFQGTTCSTELNECDSSPCANGARCTDEVNGFSCDDPERGTSGTLLVGGLTVPSVAGIIGGVLLIVIIIVIFVFVIKRCRSRTTGEMAVQFSDIEECTTRAPYDSSNSKTDHNNPLHIYQTMFD